MNKNIDLKLLNIFTYGSYKKFLKSIIAENKDIRGVQSLIALSASCQKTYLSQVLSGKSQLTPEHAIGIAKLLKLTQDETDYFINLVHFERAGTPELQKYYELKLESLIINTQKIEKVVISQELSILHKTIYYSSWIYPAIHVALSVPHLRTVSALSTKFNLTADETIYYLKQLEDMGLATKNNSIWNSKIQNIHLPESSPLVWLNHQNWRRRVQQEGDKITPLGLHYSTVCSLSHEDLLFLRTMVIDFVKKTRNVIEPSKEEEIVVLLLDFFTL